MLRFSALPSSSSSSSSSLSLNHRIPNTTNPNLVPKLFQIPRLGTLSRSSRGLFCHSKRSEDATTTKHCEELEAWAAEEKEMEGNPNIEGDRMSVGVGNASFPARIGLYRMSLGDQAFFLLAFIACTTSIAFTSLVIAAVPTLYATKRAATSLAKLADIAQEELPSTMAAIRLSGMEISDLTLELSDLSQEIADGVSKSAQVVQAAEAGIRQIGALARSRTISMMQERASLPNLSLQLVVAGAAKKTSNVVGRARETLMNLVSRGEYSSDNGEQGSDKVEY